MSNRADPTNGRNPSVYTPYFVFPFGLGVERLYNDQVEDFGPERLSGFPARYNGFVADTMPLIGALAILKDAGAFQDRNVLNVGESGVYLDRGGWHPVLHTDEVGLGGIALGFQPSPSEVDILFVLTKSGEVFAVKFPRSWDISRDLNFTGYSAQDGVLVTGWFNVNNITRNKWWEKIRVFAERLSFNHGVDVYYQTRSMYDNSSFTAAGQELALVDWNYLGRATSSTSSGAIWDGGAVWDDGTVWGSEFSISYNDFSIEILSQEIRFAIVLWTTDDTSPVMRGFNVEYLLRRPSANSYVIPVKIEDFSPLDTGEEDTLTADNAVAILDNWAANEDPLSMSCVLPTFHGKRVLIEPPSLQPVMDAASGRVSYSGSLTVYEV